MFSYLKPKSFFVRWTFPQKNKTLNYNLLNDHVVFLPFSHYLVGKHKMKSMVTFRPRMLIWFLMYYTNNNWDINNIFLTILSNWIFSLYLLNYKNLATIQNYFNKINIFYGGRKIFYWRQHFFAEPLVNVSANMTSTYKMQLFDCERI